MATIIEGAILEETDGPGAASRRGQTAGRNLDPISGWAGKYLHRVEEQVFPGHRKHLHWSKEGLSNHHTRTYFDLIGTLQNNDMIRH
jgi:hypothetical protein